MEPTEIPPDDKDWTVVITDGCPECGFDPGLDVTTTGSLIRGTIRFWADVLSRPDVRRRPRPTTWSPLEYGCHVRDVCHLFAERLSLMLTADDARFANWDQDAAAVEGAYGEQDPARVAEELSSLRMPVIAHCPTPRQAKIVSLMAAPPFIAPTRMAP